MKKTIYILMMVLAAGLSLASCHSNEKNYREAYEKAVERRKTGIGAETYAKIDAERQRYTHLINGDSVRMLYVNANIAIDTTAVAMPYNVVVASFTQRINAKSYCERLRQECGLTGSYVMQGGPEKQYYVIAQGFDNSADAAAMIHDIGQRVCLKVLEPLPWILRKL